MTEPLPADASAWRVEVERTTDPRGDDHEYWVGPARLLWLDDDLQVAFTGGSLNATVAVPLPALREVNDELRADGVFTANIGWSEGDVIRRFRVVSGDADRLSSLLTGLGPRAKAERCGHCGGAVFDDFCDACRLSREEIAEGLGLSKRLPGAVAQMAVGALLLAVGLGLTFVSVEILPGFAVLFYGLMGTGGLLMLFGSMRALGG